MNGTEKAAKAVELLKEAIRRSFEAEQNLMTTVKIVVEPICECRTEKPEGGLTVASFTRCKDCEEVFHNECFEKHREVDPEKRVPWPYNRHEVEFLEKYIKRYYVYQREKEQDEKKKQPAQEKPKQETSNNQIQEKMESTNIIETSCDSSNTNSGDASPKEESDEIPDPEACEECNKRKCMCIYFYEKMRRQVKRT